MYDYYIYLLLNPLKNNLPFYVGKGKKYRCRDHFTSKRLLKNSHKNNTIRKIIEETGKNPPIHIYCTGLDETTAFEFEINLIKFYGRIHNNSGILCNIYEGGIGISGIKKPGIEKNFKFVSRPGKLNGMYGKTHSDDARKAQSKARIEKYKKSYWWNNGEKSIMVEFPPDNTWKRGRLKGDTRGLKRGDNFT